jgi:hypothetical protein
VEATQPSNESLTVEEAVDLLVQPEEVVEDVVENVSENSDVEEPEQDEIENEVDDIEEDVESDEEEDDEHDDDDSESEEDDTEDDEVTEDDEQEPEENLYTVKVDGEEVQVTLSELQKGYSGQKYIQKGMQENAALKKQAEEVYVSLTQQRQELQNLIQQVQTGALTPPVAPDVNQYRDDPYGWHEAQIEYNEKLLEYQQQAQAVTEQINRQAENEAALRAEYAKNEARELVKHMPELSNPEQAKAFTKTIASAAEYYGYTQEEVANIMNHRDMRVLADAAKWRELQSGDAKKIVREKTKKARKPIKAGAKKTVNKNKQRQANMQKLKRTGAIEDSLALILDPNMK